MRVLKRGDTDHGRFGAPLKVVLGYEMWLSSERILMPGRTENDMLLLKTAMSMHHIVFNFAIKEDVSRHSSGCSANAVVCFTLKTIWRLKPHPLQGTESLVQSLKPSQLRHHDHIYFSQTHHRDSKSLRSGI